MAEDTPCPDGLQGFRTDLAKFADEVTRGSEPWSKYTSWFQRCEPQVRSFDTNSCSNNLRKYTEQIGKMSSSGHSLGFQMSNAEYLANEPSAALELPKELVNGLQPGWREMANQKGWKYIEYFSASVPFSNPEDSHPAYRRLAIMVPNDRGYQKWIQYVPPQTQNNNIEHVYHIDLIAIDTDGNGEKRQRHNQFVRSSLDQPFVQKPVNELNRCIACHSSGPRVIRSWPGYVTEGNISKAEMGKIIMAARNSNWGNAVDVTAIGPAYGRNQSCVGCHSGPSEGEIGDAGFMHNLMNEGQIHHKMVEALQMPPSLMGQAKYRVLKTVLGILENLTDEQKAKIQKIQMQSYEELIASMLTQGFVTSDDASVALSQLKEARAEGKANYDKLMADQKLELKKWLLGDEKCQSETKN